MNKTFLLDEKHQTFPVVAVVVVVATVAVGSSSYLCISRCYDPFQVDFSKHFFRLDLFQSEQLGIHFNRELVLWQHSSGTISDKLGGLLDASYWPSTISQICEIEPFVNGPLGGGTHPR